MLSVWDIVSDVSLTVVKEIVYVLCGALSQMRHDR